MKPLVHHNRMSDITQAEQKKLCRCSSQCEKFVVISYTRGPVLTMCEKEAIRYTEEIAIALKSVKVSKAKVNHYWKPEEISILKKYYHEHKDEYGFVKDLSMLMNRKPQQIHDKIKGLKKKGELQ